MQKLLVVALWAGATVVSLSASTLQQLSLDDMIQKSTVIVRGKPQSSYAAPNGAVIYTHYQVQVSDTYKGSATSQLDVVVPGGVTNGRRQSFSGAPALLNGQDYVLFLWTSRNGLTQVIGLSQGLFSVTASSAGQTMVVRSASKELMLDAAGKPVTDSNVQMPLSTLRTRIQTVVGGAK